MQDWDKTKEQLIDELRAMRGKVSALEATATRLLGTEKALRESEERFRLLYENAPLGYQSLDQNGYFLEVNQAWLDTLGYSREEVIGKWFGDFLAPGYREHFEINFPKFKAVGEIHWVEFEMIRKDGSQVSVAFDGQIGKDQQGRFKQTHCIMHDITDRRRAEEAIKASEARVRMKLDSILSPEGDIATLELADVIDAQAIQALMDDFFSLTNIGVGIIDRRGEVLVATGWQEICTKFHRAHPETCKHCVESDTELSGSPEQGTFKLYRCKNNMWDIATPIIVGGNHLGNIFLGQFLFEEETPDYEAFRLQARQYGFDEQQYLEALDKVPRWSRHTVDTVMAFYSKLAGILSTLGYSNIKLARSLAAEQRLLKSLRDSEQRYKGVVDNIEIGISLLNTNMEIVEVNRAFKEYFPHVRPACGQICYEQYNDPPRSEPCPYCPCVLTLKDGKVHEAITQTPAGSEIRYYHLVSSPIKDSEGQVQYAIELTEDITERKKAQESLNRANQEWAQTFNAISDGIMVLDEQYTIARANKAMAHALGMTEQDLIGKHCFELVHGATAPPAFCPHSRLLTDGQEHSVEVVEPRLGATLDVRVSPILDQNGHVRGSVHVTRDITERKRAEDALRESEELHRITIGNIADTVLLTDDSGAFTYICPNTDVIFGYSAEEVRSLGNITRLIGHNLFDHTQLEGLAEIKNIETTITDKRGEKHTLLVNIKTVDIKGGTILYTCRDITERKQFEKALQDSEERLRLTLEATQIGVWDWDVKADQWYASPTYFTMLGYEPRTGPADRREWLERVHPDDIANVEKGIRDVLTRDFKEYQYEARLRHADGTYRWQYVRGVSVNRDEGGVVSRMLGIRIDIDKPKRAEEALRASEEKYRTLFEESFDGLFITSPSGKILDMNKKTVAMFGYDSKEEVRRLDLERDVYAYPPDRKRILSMVNEQGSAEYEVLVKKKHGEQMLTYCSLSAVRNERGQVESYRGIIRDITERKLSEDLLRIRLDLLEYSATHFLEDLLQKALDEIEGLTNSSIGFYHFISEDEKTIYLQMWSTKTTKEFCQAEGKGRHYPVDKAGVWVDAVRERRPLIHNDYSSLPHRKGMPEGHPVLIRELVVPIMRSDRIVAVLGVGNKPTNYGEKDIEVVSYLADVAWEIALRKRAEEAYQAASDYNRSLIEASLDPLVTISAGGKITDVNTATESVTGYSRLDLIGTDFADYFTDPEKASAGYQEAFKVGSVSDYELDIQHRNGKLTPVMYNASVYRDRSGEVVGLFAAARDITARRRAEKLAEEQIRFQQILMDAIPNPVFFKDRAGKYLGCNEAFSKLLGRPKAEITGKSVYDLSPKHLADMYHAKDMELLTRGGIQVYESKVRYADATEHDVIFYKSTFLGVDGTVDGLIGVILDITEQKKVEQRLRESEEQYRAVFYNAGIGIKVASKDRRIYRANPALSNMLGYSEGELLELSPVDVTHPEDREVTNQYLDAILGDGPDSVRLEKRYIRKDGNVVWGDVSISAIGNTQGNRIAALEVIADITDRKKSRIALEDSEKRMRQIIDSSPVGIRITQDGGHVYANRAFASMFGYESQEEILGLPAEALFAPESRAMIRQRVADRKAGKTIPAHYEAIGMTRQGKTISLETWGTEIDYLGKKSWLAFIIDVSEAKSLRGQLLQAQKMEAVGTLAGGIAHDFNNILQVVLGFSEILLMDKTEGDKERADLQKILSVAKKGADLVKGLLAFSRKGEINLKPLNLNHVLHQARAILARTIPKTIKVDLILHGELSAINADVVQMEQVLLNLAVNARDAMPEGGNLTFETSNVSLDETYSRGHLGAEPGDYVLLTVSDTGEGMTKQTLAHIFEPFFSTKPTGEGTGLGLAMVYGIVKQHSGFITCYSELGVGTAFKLYFPVMDVKDETRVPEEAVRFPGGTETVLLVDDEELVRELAKRILSRAGYTVLAAANGREALQVYKKERKRISLVVMDLIMPEMDGKQCQRELIKINPRVKVLFASGYSAAGATTDALKGGERGFVPKPFDMGQLLQTVRRVLDES